MGLLHLFIKAFIDHIYNKLLFYFKYFNYRKLVEIATIEALKSCKCFDDASIVIPVKLRIWFYAKLSPHL